MNVGGKPRYTREHLWITEIQKYLKNSQLKNKTPCAIKHRKWNKNDNRNKTTSSFSFPNAPFNWQRLKKFLSWGFYTLWFFQSKPRPKMWKFDIRRISLRQLHYMKDIMSFIWCRNKFFFHKSDLSPCKIQTFYKNTVISFISI